MSGEAFGVFPPELREELHLLGTEICHGAMVLGTRGLSQGFGHVSARVQGADRFLITPAKDLTTVAPDGLEVVDFEGQALTTNTPEGAPSEVCLHAAIYRSRADVLAIARSLPEFVDAFGVANTPLRPVHNFGATVMGVTHVYPDPRLIETLERARPVVDALGERNSLVLRGNGCVVLGPDVMTAVVRTVWLEESARLQYRALTIGRDLAPESPVAFFSDAEIMELGSELGRPDRIRRKWAMLVREAYRTPGRRS